MSQTKLNLPILSPSPLEDLRGWRSLEELEQTPEFHNYLQHEFPQCADQWNGHSRRSFLQMMAASFALAGLSGCNIRPPSETIVPSVDSDDLYTPEDDTHYYATVNEIAGIAVGLLIATRAGRPLKIEGNPRHPSSRGATRVFDQAETLQLYDPDRMVVPTRNNAATTLENFQRFINSHRDQWDQSQGRGLALLVSPSSSPTFKRLLETLVQRWPACRIYVNANISNDSQHTGHRLVYGDDVAPSAVYPQFNRNSCIVSIGHDFLAAQETPPGLILDFANARRVANVEGSTSMARLYAIDSTVTITASKADHRLLISPQAIETTIQNLASRLGVQAAQYVPMDPSTAQFVERCAQDLLQSNAPVVLAGYTQPAEIHAWTALINHQLGSSQKGSFHWRISSPTSHFVDFPSLTDLAADLQEGRLHSLFIVGDNPVFTAPHDLRLSENLRHLNNLVYLASEQDETAVHADWVIPRSHFLECWGDAVSIEGVPSIAQPTIQPLYQSLSAAQFIASLLEPSNQLDAGYQQIRRTWQTLASQDVPFDEHWNQWLAEGIVSLRDLKVPFLNKTKSPQPLPNAASRISDLRNAKESAEQLTTPTPDRSTISMAVVFRPDPTLWDGRYANNGWLRELPKPITKLTWDNPCLISPQDADRLSVKAGDLIKISSSQSELTIPAWPTPGQPSGVLTLFFGDGRSHTGRVGTGYGFNVFPLRHSKHPWSNDEVAVTKLDETYPLACTQHHHLTHDRPILRVGTIEELQENREKAKFAHPDGNPNDDSFFEPSTNSEHRWGMSIDLTACTGCSACVIACQAENNIPVVGKQQVLANREMHWLRVDTYHLGSRDEPAHFHHQPVPCMHCELAPCEIVCPVAATTHSDDGLNQMIYNRCIGTRYCSNNCPYKVRRFNFLSYGSNHFEPATHNLLANPEVTIRGRGVMEKCTYCVQRIQHSSIKAKLSDRSISEDPPRTACQQVCPTRAIEFGDLNDPRAPVTRLKNDPLSYGLLEELNTRPRTTYLAEVINPGTSDHDA